MTASELRAFLENIVDDTRILFTQNGALKELSEDDIDLCTLEAENYVGPTVLILYTDEQH